MMKDYEDVLDAIRIDLYERTKDMKTEDKIRDMNARGRALAARYGFEIVSPAPVTLKIQKCG